MFSRQFALIPAFGRARKQEADSMPFACVGVCGGWIPKSTNVAHKIIWPVVLFSDQQRLQIWIRTGQPFTSMSEILNWFRITFYANFGRESFNAEWHRYMKTAPG